MAQGDDCVLQAGVGAAPGAATIQTQPAPQPADPNAVPAAPQGYGGQPVQQQPQQQYQYQAAPVAQPVATRTEERARTGMLIPGIIMFGVSYSIAVAVALTVDYGWLAIPFAGPLITMSELDSFDPGSAYAGLALWSLVQTAGMVLFILGLTLKRTVEVRADLGEGRSIALQPFETEGGGGLQLLGEF